MNSRMDKYQDETPELKKRTELKADLYLNNEIDDYNKIDLNSNVSLLKTDAKSIDVDKVREMLDKRYRDNIPRRKSIDIEYTPDQSDDNEDLFDTKEYDINEILAKAKTTKTVDYHEERLKKINNTNNDILENLNLKNKAKEVIDDEDELMTLINTITKLEMENQEKAKKDSADLLDLNPTEEIKTPPLENSFFTGNLVVTDKDYEDFKNIQKDIKSNSVIIKVLIGLFIILILILVVFLLNKYLDLGLF